MTCDINIFARGNEQKASKSKEKTQGVREEA